MLKYADRRVFEILGRQHPAIYDLIHPHGPLGRFDAFALNPQPLPPRLLGAAIAEDLISSFRIAERFGLDSGRVMAEVEELCPRHWKDFKLPKKGWPRPRSELHPEWFIEFQLGFAGRLAATAGYAEGTELEEVLNAAFELSAASLQSVAG